MKLTLQHIWILRILIQLNPPNTRTLHNLLFLVAADSLDQHDLAFYDFIKTKSGAFSPSINHITTELVNQQLISLDPLRVHQEGRELYYTLGSALKCYEDIMQKCLEIFSRFPSSNQLNTNITQHLTYRKVKQGRPIF